MNPDLYGAWLEAGNNLQTTGAWIGAHWMWLAGAALVPSIALARRLWIRHATRRRLAQGIRRLEQYANHKPSRPILDDFHQPRKEGPQ